MSTPRIGSLRVFYPVGWDVFDASDRTPDKGEVVKVVQPFGCPKNGTTGQVYVEGSKGVVMVHKNSIAAPAS